MDNWTLRLTALKDGVPPRTETWTAINLDFILKLMQRDSTNSFWYGEQVYVTNLKIDWGLKEATLWLTLTPPVIDPPSSPPEGVT